MPSPAPTLSSIRAEVISLIKGVMNPGNPSLVTTVHDYRRHWRDIQKFNALFIRTDVTPKRLNGWMIQIESREEELPERFRFVHKNRFQLHGFFGLLDQGAGLTEKDFLDQVEAIQDAIRLSFAIFGNTEMVSPVTALESLEVEDLADFRVWYAQVTFEAERIVTTFA